ncbi:MAG: autotransporter domain-containing protein [Selenomonadaceae bacterium]|nr:autotransporter domain-containing protein [Selenomonadaceae bacterium]
MEMTKKKDCGARRHLLAAAIFCGVSATAAQASAAAIDDEVTEDGIVISDESKSIVNVSENISTPGNAVEFNDAAFVENFNLSSVLRGSRYAIYIGEDSFVENINVNAGAEIKGDIFSAWSPGGTYDPERVTNLNINTNLEYGGNIFGADNMKIHIKDGTTKFSGAANVLSVDVGLGAKLFGGTFNLNEQIGDLTTGTFINHGTIAAGSADTNLVINGNLISDGVLQKVSGGSAGSIIVNGHANVEGSTVTTDSLLPNETATVLVAESISGNIKNPAGNPVQISAMLTATGEIVGNTLTVTTQAISSAETSPPALDKPQAEVFSAMNNMYDKLDSKKQNEMRKLYNLQPAEAGKALEQIGSPDGARVMSVAQQSSAVDRMIADRINKVFDHDHFNLAVHSMRFADGDEPAEEISKPRENNFWLNYMKNWGSLRGGTDYHGSAIVGGYDRPFGRNWRAGIFATYGTLGYGAESSRATVYDTRLGLYAGCHNRQSDIYFYINGGQLRNSLHRGISSLGLSTNANYKSRIIEIGGEYKYDLTPEKIWHVSPFVNFQASHLKQNSYEEKGAGIYNQHVESNSNTYFAAQAGLDLKRYYRTGMFGMRFGVKHGFTGADPDLTVSYEGDTASSYRLRNKRDKTHFIFSIRGESDFADGWSLGGEAEFQRGENDRDFTASVMLRRIW